MLRNQGVYISISAMFCSELEDVDEDGSENAPIEKCGLSKDTDMFLPVITGGLWQGFKNRCFGLAALTGSFAFISPSMKDSDGSKNGGLWQEFRNVCFTEADCKGSFFPSMKVIDVNVDEDGSKNGGLWQEFRNVCFKIADCKGSFFPSMKDEVNDSITKRRTVQDDSIIAQLGFSCLKMKCGVELERFDRNGLQCALL